MEYCPAGQPAQASRAADDIWPTAQRMHSACPAIAVCCPTPHEAQSEPSADDRPAMQSVHASPESVCFPEAQTTHSMAPDALFAICPRATPMHGSHTDPASLEKRPARQFSHAARASSGCEPALHSWQSTEPDVPVCCPAAQVAHCKPSADDRPAMQSVQSSRSRDGSAPSAHAKHSEAAAAAIVPCRHWMHGAPPGEARPAAQSMQVVDIRSEVRPAGHDVQSPPSSVVSTEPRRQGIASQNTTRLTAGSAPL